MKIIRETLNNITLNQFNLFLQRKNKIIFNDNIFTFLGSGGEGIVYKYNNYAIKIYKNKFQKTKEIDIMKKTTELLDNNISINFVRLYDSFNVFNHNIIIMEIADGNLEKWVLDNHTEEEWINMILQILCSILVMQKYMNMYHADMKPKNILYKKLDKQINILYHINKISFIIKTQYIFLISDFGHSKPLDDSNKLYDLEHLATLYNRLLVNKLVNKLNINQILEKYPQIKPYYDTQKDKINLDMKTYPENIKNKMILRSLIYHLIESDNLVESKQLDNIIESRQINKISNISNKIRDILEELYNEKNIYDMIIKILIVDFDNKYKDYDKKINI